MDGNPCRRRRPRSLAALALLVCAGLLGCEGATNNGVSPDRDATAPDASMTPAPPAAEVVRRPAFTPRDPARFSRAFYPEGPPETPAIGTPLDEAAARALVSETLGRRGLAADVVASARAVFDDAGFAKIVAPPALRAAFLLLQGTAGAAAIDVIRGGSFARVGFAPVPPGFETTTAWVEREGAAAVIQVAEGARGDDPRALASVLAHESLHSDADVDSKEEAICAAIEAIVYGQILLETPALARAGSTLTRANNLRLLERLNGRDESGGLRLMYAAGATLPGSQAGFGFTTEYYEPFSRSTPGNPALAAMVEVVTGMRPAAAAFDNVMVELLDAHQVVLGPEQIVALAEALDLDTAPAATVPPPDRAGSAVAPPPTAPTASAAETAAAAVLRAPPFAPRTVGLFDHLIYPAGPPDVAAAGPALDAAGARRILEATLVQRLGAGDARVAATLATFDAAGFATAIPDPAARAAVLALRGGVADTVVGAFTAGVFAGIHFIEDRPDLPFASPLAPAPQQRPVIALNGGIRFEDPRLLAPFIAEAALHEDGFKTPKELLLGRALVPLVYGQFLLEAPALARTGTRLARLLNRILLGRLNGRDADGHLRLLSGRGAIYPASASAQDSYLAVYIPYGPDTPGNPTLSDLVTGVTGVDLPPPGRFSVDAVRLLDQRQALFSATQIVTLARTLELDVP